MSTAPTAMPARTATRNVHTSEMISQGGRRGRVDAPHNRLSVQFENNNGDSSVTPELLFAGAYAACFHGALLNAATRAHQMVSGTTVIARVSLREDEKGGFYLAVELRASIPGVTRSDGERLLHLAHQTCPYSKATRGNIDVTLALD